MQALMSKLDDYLAKSVCASSGEEAQIIDSMWEAADAAERKTMATLLFKIADKI